MLTAAGASGCSSVYRGFDSCLAQFYNHILPFQTCIVALDCHSTSSQTTLSIIYHQSVILPEKTSSARLHLFQSHSPQQRQHTTTNIWRFTGNVCLFTTVNTLPALCTYTLCVCCVSYTTVLFVTSLSSQWLHLNILWIFWI